MACSVLNLEGFEGLRVLSPGGVPFSCSTTLALDVCLNVWAWCSVSLALSASVMPMPSPCAMPLSRLGSQRGCAAADSFGLEPWCALQRLKPFLLLAFCPRILLLISAKPRRPLSRSVHYGLVVKGARVKSGYVRPIAATWMHGCEYIHHPPPTPTSQWRKLSVHLKICVSPEGRNSGVCNARAEKSP